MIPIIVGVSGGTGAGKSALCAYLVKKHRQTIGLIQLDEYFKPEPPAQLWNRHINWDHPDALDFDKLFCDLSAISIGRTIEINTTLAPLAPNFVKRHKQKIKFYPKPLVLVEGHLILHEPRIRSFFKTSLWLDVVHEKRWARRIHFKYPKYEHEVLIPMHETYVEPTRTFAQNIIDSNNLSIPQIANLAETILEPLLQP